MSKYLIIKTEKFEFISKKLLPKKNIINMIRLLAIRTHANTHIYAYTQTHSPTHKYMQLFTINLFCMGMKAKIMNILYMIKIF